MIRQPNIQAYVKVFPYISDLAIRNIPEIPYYNYYKPKLISNNNNKLIYEGKFKKV